MPIIAIIGSKGGLGKTTIAAHLLVAARRAGVEAVGIDLDSQRSLLGWSEARRDLSAEPLVRVVGARLADWRQTLDELSAGTGLVVADGPPGLDGPEVVSALVTLARAAALVLIPAPPWGLELKAIGELGAMLGAAFVLNKVERGPNVEDARAFLADVSELAPIEIPKRNGIAHAMGAGLTVFDRGAGGPVVEFDALWRWAAGLVGVV